MEDQEYYESQRMMTLGIPDSPTSVMQLFDADKKALNEFAKSIIASVNDGNEDALRVHVIVKKQEYVLKQIKEGIEESAKTEAAKYGDKQFMFAGSECHLTATSTSYDFKACGDHKFDALQLEFDNIKSKLDERKEFLKAIKSPENFINDDTGEIYIVSPPLKTQGTGVKVTIK